MIKLSMICRLMGAFFNKFLLLSSCKIGMSSRKKNKQSQLSRKSEERQWQMAKLRFKRKSSLRIKSRKLKLQLQVRALFGFQVLCCQLYSTVEEQLIGEEKLSTNQLKKELAIEFHLMKKRYTNFTRIFFIMLLS